MTESSLKRRGYVVRYVPYRDSAAMVRFLSEEGFCSFSVRGASKPTSKAHFLSFVLSEDEIVLSSASGGRLSYKEGRPLLLPDLRDDLARGVAFSMAAEMLSAFVRDAEGKEAYPLLSSFMEALRRGDDALTVLASFLAKTTELIGYGINVDGCAVCGAPEPRAPMLDVIRGQLHCGCCALEGGKGLSMPLCGSSLQAMRHVISCPGKKLYAFSVPEDALGRMADAAEAFAAAQLERGFRTLDFYKKLRLTDPVQR